MHQRAVVCTMCGGKFFPASLSFHQKACAKKQSYALLPCSYCDTEIPKPDLDRHMKEACAKAPKQPKSAGKGEGDWHIEGDGGRIKGLSELLDDQGRMQCVVCHRWFLQDRIGKHQSICRAIEEKRKDQPIRVFDSFKQRQFDPLIRPALRAEGNERQARLRNNSFSASVRAARSYYSNFHKSGETAKSSDRSAGHLPATREGQSDSPASNHHTKKTSRAGCSYPFSGKSPTSPVGEISRKGGSPDKASIASSRCVSGAGGSLPYSRDAVPEKLAVEKEGHLRDTQYLASRSHPTSQASGAAGGHVPARSSKLGVMHASGNMEGTGTSSPESRRGGRRYPDVPPATRAGGWRQESRPSAAFLSSGRCTTSYSERVSAGRILQSNESSIGNPMAYPNYPGGHYNSERSLHSLQNASPGGPRSPIALQQQPRLRNSRPGGAGTILPTNETSPDNPLARGNY
ncbi:hypothetical protein TGGT1_313665 [Toxoplasma gondii GT1]|uniref:Uncharacterized protein n=2 Tax=Toxoplasma gondii TaxID=5811 RepID=S7UUK0_TOXGG|nr:hypothetical protein TGGT1_313665 [Toxoplasma gondii GT1]KAF4639508.1 hypothetical protein TGRH88_052800 [Toxoplasma gondii]